MSNFETWWEREGQEFLYALNTTTDDDIKLVAEVAWRNGAYCSEQAEQEPMYISESCAERGCACHYSVEVDGEPVAVYSAPVRTKDLTDDEIQMLWVNWDANRKVEWYECIEDLIHIVEDYIKEKQADTNTDKGKNL